MHLKGEHGYKLVGCARPPNQSISSYQVVSLCIYMYLLPSFSFLCHSSSSCWCSLSIGSCCQTLELFNTQWCNSPGTLLISFFLLVEQLHFEFEQQKHSTRSQSWRTHILKSKMNCEYRYEGWDFTVPDYYRWPFSWTERQTLLNGG